jgi:hypothetical protein
MSTTQGFVRSLPVSVQLTSGANQVTTVAVDAGVITSGIWNGKTLGPSYVPSPSSGPGAGIFTVPVQTANGTATAPSHTFTSDLTTGTYLVSAGNLGLSAGGQLGIQIAKDTGAFPLIGIGAAPVAAQTLVLKSQLSGYGLIMLDNTGAQQFSLSNTGTVRLGAVGTAASPAFGVNTSGSYAGLYGAGAGLGFSTAGLSAGSIDASQNWSLPGQLTAANGLFSGSLARVNTGGITTLGLIIGSNANGIFITSSTALAANNAWYVGTYAANAPNGYLLQGTYTIAKTSSYTVLGNVGNATDQGTHFTNAGAAGAVTFTLPTASQGLTYKFTSTAAQNLLVTAAANTLN